MDAERIRNLEALIMVQEATLAVIAAWAERDYWPDFIVSQAEASRQAYLEIMGEPPMCRSLKPLEPKESSE